MSDFIIYDCIDKVGYSFHGISRVIVADDPPICERRLTMAIPLHAALTKATLEKRTIIFADQTGFKLDTLKMPRIIAQKNQKSLLTGKIDTNTQNVSLNLFLTGNGIVH